MEPIGNPNPRAWLYQYRPAGAASWLADLASGNRVNWRIVNRPRDTKPGDVVVFWESGPEGGLRGCGQVVDTPFLETTESREARKPRWRVPVVADRWVEQVVDKQTVRQSQALAGNSFMRNPRGANFELKPHEYSRLLALMGVAAEEIQQWAAWASPVQDAEPEVEEEDAFELPEDLPPISLTRAARQIIERADYRITLEMPGPITSTRLFLSTFAPGQTLPLPEGNPAEAAALKALRDVVARFEAQLKTMASTYKGQRQAGSSDVAYSDNAVALLKAAMSSPFTQKSGGLLSADGIICALLTTQDGQFLRYMRAAGLSLDDLRDQFLRSVTAHDSLIRPAWREAFGDEVRPIGADGLIGQVRLGNDNAWSQEISDSLGAKREADAFAALSTSSSFIPPLAVGVFGDWGSGKSFFMRLVHDRIKVLSDAAKDQKDANYLGDVVQIRFNAWHYVESNLWASLVDHIFAELNKATSALSTQAADKIFQQLTTARELTISSAEQLMERRREQAHAAVFVADAEARLAAKQADAAATPSVYWSAALSALQETIAGDEDLRRRANLMGMESAIGDVTKLGDAVGELNGVKAQAIRFAQGLRKELGSSGRLSAFLGFAAILYVSISFGRDYIAALLNAPGLTEWLRGWALAVSSFCLAAVPVVGAAVARVAKALAYMTSVRDKFRKAAVERSKQSEADVRKVQDELARLTAEVAEGKARFATSTEKVGDAAREYNAKNGRGRLLGFLRSRAAGESYAKHLGLVSTVRKDFEELSDLISESLKTDDGRDEVAVKEQEEFRKRAEALIAKADLALKDGVDLLHGKEREQLLESMTPKDARTDFPAVSRIVLYIDDLDRCQPEKVVEVLQAVHLLLSFRLFIVFVAVDVRWVSRALNETYPSLLGRSAGAGSASAHDYLEKIFQVPYWVRPMGVFGSTKFMADRLSLQNKARPKAVGSLQIEKPKNDSPGASTVATAPHEGLGSTTVGTVAAPPGGGAAGPESPASSAVGTFQSDSSPGPAGAAPRTSASATAAATSGKHEAGQAAQGAGSKSLRDDVPNVELTDAEVKFMTALACSAGNSPRRLIRFLNVYQVMKATLSTDDEFASDRGDFYELMTQVAIVTGAPALLEAWHGVLQTAKGSSQVGELRDQVSKLGWDKGPLRYLDGALETLQKHRSWTDAAGLRTYSELSRRFSFGSALDEEEPLGDDVQPGEPNPLRSHRKAASSPMSRTSA